MEVKDTNHNQFPRPESFWLQDVYVLLFRPVEIRDSSGRVKTAAERLLNVFTSGKLRFSLHTKSFAEVHFTDAGLSTFKACILCTLYSFVWYNVYTSINIYNNIYHIYILEEWVAKNYGSLKLPFRRPFANLSRPSKIGTGKCSHVFVCIFRTEGLHEDCIGNINFN